MLLSQVVKGITGELISDGEFDRIAFATDEIQESFLTFMQDEKYLSSLQNPWISCVIVNEELLSRIPKHIKGVFVCKNPKYILLCIHNCLAENASYAGENVQTTIGESSIISPLAYVDTTNVHIGNNVVIEPFVCIKGRVTIEDNVIIKSGSSIGCDGFVFATDENNKNANVKTLGKIVIHKDVKIFENVLVSTSTFPWEVTEIGENTKIDVSCFIAHGSRIGQNSLIIAGAICCGNVIVEENVRIGPNAVIANRIHIGKNARISLGAVVTKNVEEGQTVSGNFAIAHRKFMENLKKCIQD